MPTIASYSIGSVGLPSTLLSGAPTVTITAPAAVVTSSTFTTEWTYTSPVARAQEAFRVRLQNVDRTFTFFDSGTVESADDEFAVPFQLFPSTNYTLLVEAYDGLDWSDPASIALNYQAGTDAQTVPEESAVGTVYEVGINGVGLMLADHPEKAESYRRVAAQLDPQRFATGETPFNEAVERYTFVGHQDWSGGEGQKYLSRDRSIETRYDYSEGVDPFEPGELSCLPEMEIGVASSWTSQSLVRTDLPGTLGYLSPEPHWWFRSAAGELTHWDGNTATAFDPGGTILSLATDGFYWYVSTGDDIYRGSTAATPVSAWSTEDTANIYWCADRLVGIDFASPDTLHTFAPDGTIVDTFTHDDCRIWSACGGDGYLWYGVLRGSKSEVRAWQLDSTDQPFVALTLPDGETLTNMFFYLGNVFISTFQGRIYRCVSNEGRLTPSVVLDENAFVGLSGWAGNGRKVAFTWQAMESDGSAGIGVIDLESGGYARWLSSENADSTAVPGGIAPYDDSFCFTVNEEGLYLPTGDYRSGRLRTSITDLESTTRKVFDSVKLATQPLNGSIEVSYSIDSNQTFHSLGTLSATGAQAREFPIGFESEAIGLQFDLTPDTLSPVLLLAQVKLHPVGLADQMVSLTVNAANEQTGLNGQVLPLSSPTRGRELARWLETLLSSTVGFQDIDWPVTRQSQMYQVMSVDYRPVGVFNRHLGRREDGGVVLVSMRRSL